MYITISLTFPPESYSPAVYHFESLLVMCVSLPCNMLFVYDTCQTYTGILTLAHTEHPYSTSIANGAPSDCGVCVYIVNQLYIHGSPRWELCVKEQNNQRMIYGFAKDNHYAECASRLPSHLSSKSPLSPLLRLRWRRVAMNRGFLFLVMGIKQ